MCTVKGTEDIKSPHGIPVDLLDRLLIVRTTPYAPEEIRQILKSRIKIEGLQTSDAGLEVLARKGQEASLRYAIQLLTPASILSKISGREEIVPEDVGECEVLFLTARESAALVQERGGYIA